MQDGVLLMGTAALLLLLYTNGSVSALVVMYSINVFLTFTLSQYGMASFFFRNREKDKAWKRHIAVHIVGLVLCLTILFITVYEKFDEGGWVTILITSGVIGICYLIQRHYRKVRRGARQLEEILSELPKGSRPNNEPLDPKKATAILLVRGFSGFGLHVWLSVVREFPKLYKNFIFVSVGEIDSGSFKGIAEIDALKEYVQNDLTKYVQLVRSYGFPADYRMGIGTDVADTATQLCESLAKEYPRSTVFTGKLIFRQENPFQKILHNETAFAIQRRLQWIGITTVILPVRVDI
jgi:K+ transporter